MEPIRLEKHIINGKETLLYKNDKSDRIFWVFNPGRYGEHLFTFDCKKIYNLFHDYPWHLSSEERKIFDDENPYWADFFKDR